MRLAILLLSAFVMAMPLLAKSDKAKKGKKEELSGFSTQERGIIRSTLPPGLQKKLAKGKQLPPGWAKKVRVGERFPAQYLEYVEPVPVTIIKQLPPIRPTEEIVRVENKIIKIVKATQLIIDVFEL